MILEYYQSCGVDSCNTISATPCELGFSPSNCIVAIFLLQGDILVDCMRINCIGCSIHEFEPGNSNKLCEKVLKPGILFMTGVIFSK